MPYCQAELVMVAVNLLSFATLAVICGAVSRPG